MALPSDEHERLLSLYRDRVDAYIGVDPDYGQRWRNWCQALLSFGGSLGVPPRAPEPDLDALLVGGCAFGPAARSVPGGAGGCYRHGAALWVDGGGGAAATRRAAS